VYAFWRSKKANRKQILERLFNDLKSKMRALSTYLILPGNDIGTDRLLGYDGRDVRSIFHDNYDFSERSTHETG